jgi:phenylacetate-CoA ligase
VSLESYKLLAHHIAHGLPLFLKMNIGDYRKIADRRLRFMVKHAYENVPLYRRKYDEAGVKPEDIKSIDDLYKLPLISKQDIIDGYPNDIIAKNIKSKDYYLTSTSGSSGTPVRIFKSRSLLSACILGTLFIHKILGFYLDLKIKPKSMMSIFVEAPDSLEGVNAAEKRKLPSFIFKHALDFNALDTPENHVNNLNKYKPDSLFTYPSVLRNMAVFAMQNNLKMHQPGLLLVSGELLDENTRRTIERVFTGEIINMYISTEGGFIATECKEHKGMHLKSSAVLVELLKKENTVEDGDSGEVVITDLWNEATPIIRYSGLKDIGRLSLEPCGCHQKTPILKVVEGRVADSIVLRDGRVLHPFSLTLTLETSRVSRVSR